MGVSTGSHRIGSSAPSSSSSSSPSSTTSSLADSILHDLDALAPRCARCRATFDVQTRLPFLLTPCLHTVCASCLSETDRQKCRRKRGRCAQCSSKCTAVALNILVLSLSIRLKLLAAGAVACSECRRKLPCRLTRRCRTCELEVLQKTAIPRASCVVCAECALDNHRSHRLERHGPQSSSDVASSSKTSQLSKSSPSSSARSKLSPPRDATPKTPLQKVISLPLRLAGGLLRKVLGERSTPLDFLYRNADKRDAMNSRHFATLFDMTPKSNRYKESKENFWWSLGQEAARTPPFLLGGTSSGNGDERKSRRDASRHAKLNAGRGTKPKASMTSTYQLLAGDMLLEQRDQRLVAAAAAASRQHFYSNGDFFEYVNLTRDNVPESRANNFDNFAVPLADVTLARCRKRSTTAGPAARKFSAPPPPVRVPLAYSKIV